MAFQLTNPLPGLTLPALTPLWNEVGIGVEAANLLRSRVFRGEGVMRGDGRGVLLIPGFLAGDGSLATMTGWLRRCGYQTSRAGMRSNVDCSARSIDRLAERLHALAARTGGPVAIVGQSRGGTLARVLAVKYPDVVSGVVGLGAPFTLQLRVHPLVYAHVLAVGVAGTARIPGMLSTNCLTGDCCRDFRDAMVAPMPAGVPLIAVYSKRDGIVDWHACLDPCATAVEVRASHCGMAVDAATYRAVANALGDFARDDEPWAPPLAEAA